MIIERSATDTLTPVQMHHRDEIHFRRCDDVVITIEVIDTGAEIIDTTLEELGVEEPGARTTYRFWADMEINGSAIRYEREVGTQKSFYDPLEIDGVRIWLDAVEAIFDFMRETHGPCRPRANCSRRLPARRQARIVLQDASQRICPEKLSPWCPLPENGLDIADCYRGEDCWLGAFDGASAHGGLDLNHPAGTPLYAPIDLDDQFLYNTLDRGNNNNRWRGTRQWHDGTQWIIESCHMLELKVPEHTSLEAGCYYANGAGVYVGEAEHSHFAFAVVDHGKLHRLDPWILFWQMYRDTGE